MHILHFDDDTLMTPRMRKWLNHYKSNVKHLRNCDSTATNNRCNDDFFGDGEIFNSDEITDEELATSRWARVGIARNIDTDSLRYHAVHASERFWNALKITGAKGSDLPDIILLDLRLDSTDGESNLPDGIAILKKIKKQDHLRHIPIIMLSNYHSADEITLSYVNGANAYVTKGSEWQLQNRFLAVVTHWSSIISLGESDTITA